MCHLDQCRSDSGHGEHRDKRALREIDAKGIREGLVQNCVSVIPSIAVSTMVTGAPPERSSQRCHPNQPPAARATSTAAALRTRRLQCAPRKNRERKSQDTGESLQGLDDFADAVTSNEGLDLIEVGHGEEGSRLFHSKPIDPENGKQIAGLTAEGNIADAEKYLKAVQAKYPDGTLWKSYWNPKIRDSSQIVLGRRAQAKACFQPRQELEMRFGDSN
jgi:hypothetical protein